jgi:hypothetical protein
MNEDENKNVSSEFDSAESPQDENAHIDLLDTEFAFKLVNAVKSINLGEISHYEITSAFRNQNELGCFYLFVKALPYDPINPIYPEKPFLFFKGVPVPKAYSLDETTAKEIEIFLKGQNDSYFSDLRLHDLDDSYLDAFENGIRMYNDLLDKTRHSYQENVKVAKSQVWEVSAVMACIFVIAMTLIGIS